MLNLSNYSTKSFFGGFERCSCAFQRAVCDLVRSLQLRLSAGVRVNAHLIVVSFGVRRFSHYWAGVLGTCRRVGLSAGRATVLSRGGHRKWDSVAVWETSHGKRGKVTRNGHVLSSVTVSIGLAGYSIMTPGNTIPWRVGSSSSNATVMIKLGP